MIKKLVNFTDADNVRRILSEDSKPASKFSAAREIHLEGKLREANELIDRLIPYFEAVEKLRQVVYHHHGAAGCSRSGYNSQYGDYSWNVGDLGRLCTIAEPLSNQSDTPVEPADSLVDEIKKALVNHWKEENRQVSPISVLLQRRDDSPNE